MSDDGTGSAIAMAKSDTYTPKAEGPLSAKASYTDGEGTGKSMVGTEAEVVANIANVAPKFASSETGMREVAEGTAAGEPINDDDDDAEPDPVVATDDNEADVVLTYTLGGADAASFDIGRTSGQLQTKAKLDYETKNSYDTVTVTATDAGGLSASIDVTITVTNVDEAPKIAGDDVMKDYPENGRGQVARFTARDPEGRTVYWSLAPDDTDFSSVPGVVDGDDVDVDHFMISSGGVLSFKFSPDYEMPRGADASAINTNTYKVVVAASDNALGAGTNANPIRVAYKKVTVMVTKVEETETVTLSAQQGQADVQLTATYNDVDNEKPTSTTLTWKWYLGGAQVPGGGVTSTDLTSTYTPVNAGSLRAEASYTRTDGTKKAVSKTVSVRAAPLAGNVLPTFGDEGSDARSVDENSPPGTRVGSPVTAVDPSDKLTYALTDESNSFDINPATGQIKVGARITLDTETTASYPVTVMATDPWGMGATQVVTITIKNVNEAPMMTGGFTRNSQPEYDDGTDEEVAAAAVTAAKMVATYEATDTEISAGDNACVMASCTWSISGTDAGDFKISNEDGTFGVLTFKEAPNFEKPADSNKDNVYMVTVVATDSKKATAMRDVTITITNVDEAGTVTLSSEQPKIGIPLTATLEDPDGFVDDSVKWTWHLSDDGTGSAIAMAKSDTYTPKAAGPLSAKASYTDGEGTGKSAVGTTVAPVVVNTANVAPKFPSSETGMREVAEGPAADPAAEPPPYIEEAVTATDANELPGEPKLTYTLSGTDAASFDIDRPDGQLKNKAKLDYETKNSYMVTVTATDSDGLSASIDVTIKVTDVDEAPEITVGGLAISGIARVDYAEDRRDAVATYRASGPDADMATWTLEGVDAGDFDISSSGELTFVRAPDYETPADMGGDNMYQVTVKADDGTDMDTHDVAVTVTDVDESAPSDPLLAKYDNNPQDDRIGREEVLDGIDAFFLDPGPALREEVLDLIDRFFEDLGS